MSDIQARIANLKEAIQTIECTHYPKSYDESRTLMIHALKDRVKALEELCPDDCLPASRKYQ